MSLPEKELTCPCGHTFTAVKSKTWCDNCGKPVFYKKADAIKNKANYILVVSVLALIFAFLAYIFTEMIATPLLG